MAVIAAEEEATLSAAAGSCAQSIEKGDISSASESAAGADADAAGAGEANEATPLSAA